MSGRLVLIVTVFVYCEVSAFSPALSAVAAIDEGRFPSPWRMLGRVDELFPSNNSRWEEAGGRVDVQVRACGSGAASLVTLGNHEGTGVTRRVALYAPGHMLSPNLGYA